MNAATKSSAAKTIRFGLLRVAERQIGITLDCLNEICAFETVQPLVSARPEVIGAIDLRGSLIPLLDAWQICHLGKRKEKPSIAAILKSADGNVALAVDEVTGISEAFPEDLQPLYSGSSTPNVPVVKTVLQENRSVNMLDVGYVFDLPGLPIASGKPEAVEVSKGNEVKTFLTFRAGGAFYAIEAVRTYGTVPRQDVDAGPMTGGSCLGTIQYLGKRIPVMDATEVFGLGYGLEHKRPEIVVLNFPGSSLLGFAVDEICRVQMVRKMDHHLIPDVFGGAGTVFSSMLIDEDQNQIFVLDGDVLERREELLTMASLSDRTDASTEEKEQFSKDEVQKSEVEKIRKRFLIFSAGQPLAAPITQIVSVLKTPSVLTPIERDAPHILGIFSHGGLSVPLVCLSTRLGGQIADIGEYSRVLLVGPRDRRIGLLVSEVQGIETSMFQSRDENCAVSDTLVNMQNATTTGWLPCLDLDNLAASVVIRAI